MKLRLRVFILLFCFSLVNSALLVSSQRTPSKVSEPLAIPQGKPADVDGRIAQNVWDDAATSEIIIRPDWKTQVRMKHDGEFLYFFFQGVKHGAERLFPEILIDPQNRRGNQWEKGEWWFHISFNLCEGNGEPNVYKKDGVFQCSHQKEGWVATNPPAGDVIEVKISFVKLGIKPAAGMRLGLAVGLTDATGDFKQKWFFSPQTANINRPVTWGEAILK